MSKTSTLSTVTESDDLDEINTLVVCEIPETIKVNESKVIEASASEITKVNTPKIIYPKNAKKYGGWIDCETVAHYIDGSNVRQHGFKGFEDAEKYRRKRSIELGQVRNICFDMGDYYEMALTGSVRTKIDKNMFALLDKNIWFTHNSNKRTSYARMSISAKKGETKKYTFMHNLILNFTPNNGLTVDHINRDGLDNRLANLRIANKIIQGINKNQREYSSTNVTGVLYVKLQNGYRACWKYNGKQCSKFFSVLKYGEQEAFNMAIKCREDAIKEIIKKEDIHDKKPILKPMVAIKFTAEEEEEFERELNSLEV
jgi:hypothetical protein